ncbi:MAG: OmpH family outer membrane protein [Prevotella sp.]|nr:OmpH family outer membrane protein [Prevotella sp.]
MKKTISWMTVIALMAIFMVSCNNEAPKVEQKSSTDSSAGSKFKIAYVEVDSLMSQYNFCKDFSDIIEKKGQNIQKTLQDKESALQAAVNKFQQDIQSNKYTQQQAESVQASLQKQNADLQALQQRLYQDFQTETDKYNNALRDSLQHYLSVYNKDKKYNMILSKAGDNILLADKSFDITNEVVAGLNKAYKGIKK